MEDFLTFVKVGLALELEKQGSSLEEMEAALETQDETSLAKVASTMDSLIKALTGAGGVVLSEGPGALLALSMAAGTGLGGLGYGIKKHLDSQDARLEDKEKEVARITNATNQLKADYGIK